MIATTPTPAHEALIGAFESAVDALHDDFSHGTKAQRLAKVELARIPLLAALAPAAPVLPVSSQQRHIATGKDIEWQAHVFHEQMDKLDIPRADHDAHYSLWGRAKVALAAQQPTPVASPAEKLSALCEKWGAEDASAQVMQPVEASPSAMRKALEIAVRQNSHDMLMTGEELRQCGAALATAEVAAPVAPTSQRLNQIAELMRAIDAYAHDYRFSGKLAPVRDQVQREIGAALTAAKPQPLSDAQIQRLWDDACQDTPQAPGWNRHIRFARAILALQAEGGAS